MCFSASASFVAGAGLSAVGVVTLKKTKREKEIPFAAIPLLFGIQQTIEGVVWLTFSYSWPLIHTIVTYGFALIAYAFWPMFVPFAVKLLEKEIQRKKILSVLQMIGLAVGIYLIYSMIHAGVTSTIDHESIRYHFEQPFGYYAFVLYLIAGCGSCLISSHKMINLFGILLLASLLITYFLYSTYIVSIWCFFAAILSGVTYLYFSPKLLKSK